MNPYKIMPKSAFWRSGVVDPQGLQSIHTPKWKLNKDDCIVTMGSCFAQHVGRKLKSLGYNVPYFDVEEGTKNKNFSANYGNIYTVRQALQLVREAAGDFKRSEVSWEVSGGYIDPIRPNSLSHPFRTENELFESRDRHLKAVRSAIQELDVLVFTLGLTEAWECIQCGSVLPVVPGVLGGVFSKDRYRFVNFGYEQIVGDLNSLIEEVKSARGGKGFRLLLTVSPVPLTATAENRHVLVSSVASKSILRAAADYFAREFEFVDYFPAFEIVTCPQDVRQNYEDNLRSVAPSAVEKVMGIFEASYEGAAEQSSDREKGEGAFISDEVGDVDCEDALLDQFSKTPEKADSVKDILFFGNSHMGYMRNALSEKTVGRGLFVTLNFLKNAPFSVIEEERFQKFHFTHPSFTNIDGHQCESLVLVGYGLMGDWIVRSFGPLMAGYEGCLGTDISPNIPTEIKDENEVRELFKRQLGVRVAHLRMLVSLDIFRNIVVIASPDMTERTARFRFGEEFVESNVYVKYKSIYKSVMEEMFNEFVSQVDFILHDDEDLNSEYGFAKNKYAVGKEWDIHPGREYYVDSGIEKRILRYVDR